MTPTLKWSALFFAAGTVIACGGSGGGDQGSGGGGPSGGTGSGLGSGGSIAITPSCDGPAAADDLEISSLLPSVTGLTGVRACTTGDAVNVTFDPLDDAKDYRIYPLPKDADLSEQGGTIVVKNAIYRCAGTREALYMLKDVVSPDEGWNDNAAGGTTYQNGDIEGFTRSEDDATLGYVFASPGPDRVPVYVIGSGDPTSESDPSCGRAMFDSTRPKIYTTDEGARDEALANHGRDDGIAFYVPKASGGDTQPVFEGTFGNGDTLRWVDGPEASARGAGKALFHVLKAKAKGTLPLMRIHVMPYCALSHDELVAGTARYAKVRTEGDHLLTALRWSGITEDTVLVVEALDQGCPYQGNLSPEHQDAFTETFGDDILEYEAFLTIDDMRKASSTGEVFVNGQYDEGNRPRAIARTFLKVAPNLPEDLDYFATFPEDENFRSKLGEPTGNPYMLYFEGKDYSFSSYSNSNVHFGSMLGEFFVAYNDIAADTPGKVRLTPHQKAEVTDDSFLHVTAEFDMVSTDRRYSQILISDRPAPIQDSLPQGTTIVVQPKDMTPSQIQVQICDHRNWDVNDQCPRLRVFTGDFAPPVHFPGERAGTNNASKLDIFLSTQRIYVMLNDKPYACTNLSATAEDGASHDPPSGPVTVTWGDVLYHSGVDFAPASSPLTGDYAYNFHRDHMHKTARRHLDNFGFSSKGPRPKWDEKNYPCGGNW